MGDNQELSWFEVTSWNYREKDTTTKRTRTRIKTKHSIHKKQTDQQFYNTYKYIRIHTNTYEYIFKIKFSFFVSCRLLSLLLSLVAVFEYF